MTKLASPFRVACVFLIWICACSSACAQNPRGALRGTIQDASGARVPGAKITLRNAELALTRETQSDARGEFRIEDLPPASYVVTVDANLFAQARAEVTISTSSVREINVSLQPKALAEKVLVTAPTQSITTENLDTSSAVHEAVIYRQDLETIPLAARSFANIAYLAPGTEPVEPSDPTKARITAVATGGSSGSEQRNFRGWWRQFRRLHWRLPAEFFAGRHSGVCVSHRASRRRHRADHRRLGSHHHA